MTVSTIAARIATLLTVSVAALSLAGTAEAAGKCDNLTYASTGLEHGRAVHHHHTYMTLLADARLRVIQTREDVGAKVYSCWRANGHLHLIGVQSAGGARATDQVIELFRAAGDRLAYHVATEGDRNADRYAVIQPSTGHALFTSPDVPAPITGRPAAQLVLAPSGRSLAWLAADGLHETAIGGDTTLLAGPEAGAITDVAAAGTTVYWTQAGTAHAAPLI